MIDRWVPLRIVGPTGRMTLWCEHTPSGVEIPVVIPMEQGPSWHLRRVDPCPTYAVEA